MTAPVDSSPIVAPCKMCCAAFRPFRTTVFQKHGGGADGQESPASADQFNWRDCLDVDSTLPGGATGVLLTFRRPGLNDDHEANEGWQGPVLLVEPPVLLDSFRSQAVRPIVDHEHVYDGSNISDLWRDSAGRARLARSGQRGLQGA